MFVLNSLSDTEKGCTQIECIGIYAEIEPAIGKMLAEFWERLMLIIEDEDPQLIVQQGSSISTRSAIISTDDGDSREFWEWKLEEKKLVEPTGKV